MTQRKRKQSLDPNGTLRETRSAAPLVEVRAFPSDSSSNDARDCQTSLLLCFTVSHTSERSVSVAYKLTDVLGRGAFGTVHLAAAATPPATEPSSNEWLPDTLAVKILPKHQPNTAAELNIYRCLPPHRNIVRLYLAGYDDAAFYLFMEVGTPYTLRDLVARCGQDLNFRDVVSIGRSVLRAIAHCHQNGIAHRDVKLENFVFAKDPSSARRVVKLLDFGSALYLRDQVCNLAGTPHYAAPEAAAFVLRATTKSSHNDTSCDSFPQDSLSMDSWSCGVALWELTWRRPDGLFDAENDEEVLRKICAFARDGDLRRERYHALIQRCRACRGEGRVPPTEFHVPTNFAMFEQQWVRLILRLLNPEPSLRLRPVDVVCEHSVFDALFRSILIDEASPRTSYPKSPPTRPSPSRSLAHGELKCTAPRSSDNTPALHETKKVSERTVSRDQAPTSPRSEAKTYRSSETELSTVLAAEERSV